MYSRQNLHNTEKEEDLTESTSVVPTKYPPKVKLENFYKTLKCQSWGKVCVPWFLGAFGFYNSVEPT